MKIGLVIACKAEFNEFIKLFPKHKIKDYGNFKVYIVNYFGNKIFCVRSGVTRINASIKTQFLIDKFKVDMIINAGTCAHLKGKAEVGDVFVVEKCSFWDLKLDYVDKIAFDFDKTLVDSAVEKLKIKKAFLVTGDDFVNDKNKVDICKKFKPDICDMEGTAVAYTCDLNNKPCLLLKAVSDGGDENDWDKNVASATEKVLKTTLKYLKEVYKK